jgi:hypothetical protein
LDSDLPAHWCDRLISGLVHQFSVAEILECSANTVSYKDGTNSERERLKEQSKSRKAEKKS